MSRILRQLSHTAPARNSGERGFALIIVLLVVALLGLVVGDLAMYSWYAQRTSQNFTSDAQHAAATDGLLRLLCARLSEADFTATERKKLLAEGVRGLALGDTVTDAAFEDESGKLNLNGLASSNQAIQEWTLQAWTSLAAALKVDEAVATSIADFVAARSGGDGQGEMPQAIMLLEELRDVEGVTDALLYGSGGTGGVESQGLSGYVTCWGGTGVNVNTAPQEVLEAVLADVAPGKAEVLVNYRAAKEFESLAEVAQVLGLDAGSAEPLANRLTFMGGTVQVTVMTRCGPSRLVTRAVVDPGSSGKGIVRLCRRSP